MDTVIGFADGVHPGVAPIQVSLTKIAIVVAALNATNLPSELIEGRPATPLLPATSTEEPEQLEAPMQVSVTLTMFWPFT